MFDLFELNSSYLATAPVFLQNPIFAEPPLCDDEVLRFVALVYAQFPAIVARLEAANQMEAGLTDIVAALTALNFLVGDEEAGL